MLLRSGQIHRLGIYSLNARRSVFVDRLLPTVSLTLGIEFIYRIAANLYTGL